MHGSHPVFFDSHFLRWKLFIGGCALSFSLIAAMYGVTLVSILRTEKLPRVFLPQPVGVSKEGVLSFSSSTNVPLVKNIIATYSNGDSAAHTSLTRHIGSISTLIPEWLHLEGASPHLVEDDPKETDWVLSTLAQHSAKPEVIPVVNNYDPRTGTWNSGVVVEVVTKPDKRSKLIRQLLAYVSKRHLSGIEVDFEECPEENQREVSKFIEELYGQFHSKGLKVIQTLQAFDSVETIAELLPITDYFYLPLVDERWNIPGSGPVSSREWFEAAVNRTVIRNPEHWMVGVGSYGYQWESIGSQPRVISVSEAFETAAERRSSVIFDTYSGNMRYSNKNQTVWFTDEASYHNQTLFLKNKGILRSVLWRLGTEDESIWSETQSDTMHLPYDLRYQGDGEVLYLDGKNNDGRRSFKYDVGGKITSENVQQLPSSYHTNMWGGGLAHSLALTFDDGPDPAYTEDILTILRKYNVPATFFIIGDSARHYPDLLKSIYEAGHEIGNHTYLHSNVSLISAAQLRFEINATDTVLQSILGHRSLLFRPPYAIDSEPSKREHILPLILTSSMGYYTVDMRIDPNDWRPGKTKNQIVQAVLAAAKARLGHVVLLHDGGGNRSQTVAALPDIIEGLQREGYDLVPVSSLMGLSRDQVMPATTLRSVVGVVNRSTFNSIGLMGDAFYVLFILSVGLGLFRLFSTACMAFWQARVKKSIVYNTTYLPSIAVIVPAYNEENVIVHTVNSLLKLSYPSFEIVIIDDGSVDQTYDRLTSMNSDNSRIKIFTKENEGKAKAINFGLSKTDADVVVTVDADTQLHPEALMMLGRHFIKSDVGAVAGNAKVGNRLNLLTRWQALEYIMGQNLDRRAFSMLNCICVVPGAIGAWRRDLIVSLGGFQSDTLAEDTDLTLEILKHGHTICYEDEAIAFTEAPSTISGFIRQRFRWVYGTLQSVWKHRSMFAQRKCKNIGLIGLPNLLVFQVMLPLLGPVMDIMLITSLMGLVWQRYQHPETYSLDSVKRIGFYYVFFFVLELITGISAMLLEKNEDWRLVLWLPLQRFFYRQLLYVSVLKSVLAAIRGNLVGWGSLRRMGTVRYMLREKPPHTVTNLL